VTETDLCEQLGQGTGSESIPRPFGHQSGPLPLHHQGTLIVVVPTTGVCSVIRFVLFVHRNDNAMYKRTRRNQNKSVNLNNLRYEDDTALIVDCKQKLQQLLDVVVEESERKNVFEEK